MLPVWLTEEIPTELLKSRRLNFLEPISSMDNLQPLKQTCNQSCTHSGNRDRYSRRETYNRNIYMISRVMTPSNRLEELKQNKTLFSG